MSFTGPHMEPCLNGIWLDAGCLESGQGYPGDLVQAEFDTIAGLSLTSVPKYYNILRKQSDKNGICTLARKMTLFR